MENIKKEKSKKLLKLITNRASILFISNDKKINLLKQTQNKTEIISLEQIQINTGQN